MPPAWRLAINSLSTRRRRSGLLAAAVALSAALIAAVACAIASVNHALRREVQSTVGTADVRIKAAGDGRTVPASMLREAGAWPEVREAIGRIQAPVAVQFTRPVLVRPEGAPRDSPERAQPFVRRDVALSATALASGATGEAGGVPPYEIVAGRAAAARGEVVIDQILAARLSAEHMPEQLPAGGFTLLQAPTYVDLGGRPRGPVPPSTLDEAEARRLNELQRVQVGDTIRVVRQTLPGVEVPAPLRALADRFERPVELTVVGVARPSILGGRAQMYATVETLELITGTRGGFTQVDLVLHDKVDPDAVVAARADDLPENLLIQTTEKVTSGLEANLRSGELGFALASVLAFLAASFIIVTGLTTGVTERQRELAIIRCVGGTRGQLARMQLLIGLALGVAGAALGVPLGIGLAAAIAWFFRDTLHTGLVVPPTGIGLSVLGAVASGVGGAAWPAWKAASVSPLRALASRAVVARPRGLAAATAVGLACVAAQILVVGLPRSGQVAFWAYATFGLPAMFVGYFLVGVPAMLLAARFGGPLVSRLLGLPPSLLGRTIAATPYRYGFTAGALMGGLALMVAIWTNGRAVLRDWLDRIEFPDAFVTGLALRPEHQRALEALPFVERTAAVTLHQVDTDAFGVRALQHYKTTFVAFEPRPFFEMTRLVWIQGDPQTARRRLEEGGAVIVAREFLVAQGLGVGDTFTATDASRTHTFEIVGVVASPGLEVISKFFNVGDELAEQALHAVFGSRRDLRERFGSDAIHMIQIDLADDVSDAEAVAAIRRELFGAGVLDVGSGRAVKREIRAVASNSLLASSAIAIVAMLIACFGVANLIIAGIEARRFEFGVLRAVGAHRGLLGRLVLGEAVLIAIAAMALGTLMGSQGAWAGQRLYALLLGLDLRLRPPPGPIAAGWLIVLVLALLAAGPAARRLNRQRPRELLAAMRG